jgi:hypothetical protein
MPASALYTYIMYYVLIMSYSTHVLCNLYMFVCTITKIQISYFSIFLDSVTAKVDILFVPARKSVQG